MLCIRVLIKVSEEDVKDFSLEFKLIWFLSTIFVDSVAMVYKVTQPKLLFCDAENYQTALEVNNQLQLNAPIFVMNDNDIVEGVGHIKDLLKVENDMSDKENFR